jgi:hypothetical protein
MSEHCTVIVGAPELHDALRECAAPSGEVLIVSDDDPVKALETIARRRPQVVAVERLFAATSRGATLINHIKANASLVGAEIRVVAHDGTYQRVSPRRTPPARHLAGHDSPPAMVEPAPPAFVQEYAMPRRAGRTRMAVGTELQVDGALATVVDLSAIGAQIVSPTPLKPAQVIRVVLADNLGHAKFTAAVAWSSFEIPKGVSRYRAGIEFKGAEASSVDAFCRRHAERAKGKG